jgi:hypothetical protein
MSEKGTKKYQHITDRPEPNLAPIMDERYTGRKKCSGCSKCSEVWNGSEMIPTCKRNGFLTEIAKVEGEGNFHKAMKILGNETKNNNWKDVFICSEINGIQGCWAKSVKHGPPWIVVGFDTSYSRNTKLSGRKVFNYE